MKGDRGYGLAEERQHEGQPRFKSGVFHLSEKKWLGLHQSISVY